MAVSKWCRLVSHPKSECVNVYTRGFKGTEQKHTCFPAVLMMAFLSAFLNSSMVLRFLMMPSARTKPAGTLSVRLANGILTESCSS